MTSPRDSFPYETYPASYGGPPRLPLPPTPGLAFAPPRPYASGPRLAVGILQAVASFFVGCWWLYWVGLCLVLRVDVESGSPPFWVVLGAIGAVIALSGLGGIGTAATARRPVRDRWVRVWISMSCVFGGLPVAIVVSYLVWTQVLPA